MRKAKKTIEQKLEVLINDLLDNADDIDMSRLLAKIQIGKISIDYLKIKHTSEEDKSAAFFAELEEKTKALQEGKIEEDEE
jgi:hypothetical protein